MIPVRVEPCAFLFSNVCSARRVLGSPRRGGKAYERVVRLPLSHMDGAFVDVEGGFLDGFAERRVGVAGAR